MNIDINTILLNPWNQPSSQGLSSSREKDERPWEYEVTEQAKVRLGCGKILANKVIDNYFILNVLISSKVDKYKLRLSSL